MAVNRDKLSEPFPRQGHVSALVDGKVYVWGADTGGAENATIIYSFHPLSESWSRIECLGPTPPGLEYAACASAGHHLYVYGGRGKEGGHSNFLHQLDLRRNTWRMISSDGPGKKRGCGLMACDLSSHLHLLLIGGRDGDHKDTNEIHMFDLNECKREGLRLDEL